MKEYCSSSIMDTMIVVFNLKLMTFYFILWKTLFNIVLKSVLLIKV